MSAVSCEVCQAQTDAPLCQTCSVQLRNWLLEIPDQLTELDVNLTRQARSDQAGGSTEPDTDGPSAADAIGATPWPLDPRASERADALRAEISKWAMQLHRVLPPFPRPEPQTEHLTRWLAANTNTIRRQPWAPSCHRGTESVHHAAQHLIDRPPEMDLIGQCTTCHLAVYAPRDAVTAYCRCGQTLDTYAIRVAMLKAKPDELVIAARIPWLLAVRGLSTPPSTIRSWIHRGELTAAGVNPKGQPLYRLGDALDRVTRPATAQPA